MLSTYSELHETSKVWIFQSSEELNDKQIIVLKEKLNDFLKDWTAHNVALKTFADILHRRFIILMVDETYTHASGCSIDKMTRFIQDLGILVGVDFLDRMEVAYLTDDQEIKTSHLNHLSSAMTTGEINPETIVFNNLVTNKSDFENKWKVKITESWHKRFV